MESTFDVSQLDPQDQKQFVEESLPLITFNNETQKFEVNQELQEMFLNLKGPVGVIAVAGQYRTGKSYLLNRMLLNRQKGFGVGPTINPCTKGLWIWGTPIQGFTPDGQPINVLVVDSEGIGGLDEDNNHDMRIFSLAMLLSSYFLYNSVGSIDENALSNLSLVTNLTKHIQFKSRSNESEQTDEDIDELIQYLPSFMWVVRDFALQLCDENGNDINSKDYLERALQEKGSDSKNDIRKHLKRFFKDRECCTMIRPLTNEEELQNLEQMELEELRAEFVEQVMLLRRKVLNQIKPKTINNQVLSAVQWISIVEQYVKAINEGCVPNIQSSWTYICRQNASKALDQCKDVFEKEVSDVVNFPMNHEDLCNILADQRQQCLKMIQRLIQGDQEILSEYNNELTKFLDDRASQMQKQNQYECRNYAGELLNQLFTEFDQQVRTQQPFDAIQLEQTLREVQQVYDQNAFDFDEKQVLISEAKATFLYDTLFYLNKKLESDFQLQRQLDVQTKERLEQQLKEAKEESRNERNRLDEKLRQTMIQKSELEANLSFVREQLDSLKQQKEQEESEYKDTIRKLKDQTTSQYDDFRSQKDDFEEKIQQLQRHLLQVESEVDKERALFEQKVEFLEKSLQEKSLRERDFLAERQSKQSGLSTELRSMQQKFEIDLKSLQSSLEDEKERTLELENALKIAQTQLDEKSEFFQIQETGLRNNLQMSQDQAKQLEATVQALKKETDQKTSQQIKDKDEKIDQQTAQIQELENQVKDFIEQLKLKDHEYKKENAIKDQRYQFLEMQLQDLRDQLEESYKQHEQVVQAMKHNPQEDDSRRKLSPSKLENLQNELQKTTEQYQQELNELKRQNELYVEQITHLELNLKLNQGDAERENNELKIYLQDLENQKILQNEKVRQLELQRVKLIEENDKKYKQAVQRFEDEIEHKTQQTQLELKEMQTKSEEALAQLKNFYEIEKETLEQRIAEERDKNSRRLAHFQEELELRMRDELQEKDEEIECLQNELRENEARHQNYVTQMEHELSLKQQMMETLERQVRESRERIELLEYGKNSAFEKQIEHFEQQRQEYNQKIDKLQIENLEKDRQIAQIQHRLERLNDDIERKKNDFEQSKTYLDREKKQLSEKLELTKKKLVEAQDDAIKQKLDLGREQALSKQQIEFQNKKIEELQKQTDDSQRFFDEKIKIFRAEIQEEAQAQIERITSEKELWENKYEQKRRALKEIEMSLSKSNTELEKKIAQLNAQIDRLEDDKRQMEEQFQEEIQALNHHIQQLDSSAGAAYYYGSAHAEDVLKYKQQVQDLERELSDLQSTYDRDKALWEGKCQFLETQKETYKRDLNESQKKFEITLEQLQKRGNMDKDKLENNQQSLIKVIEGKYKNQIKEMLETHQQLAQESQQKIKRLENEVKLKNEQIQMDARGKMSEYGSLEKKVIELGENEKRLLMELDEVKNERDRRVQDYQRQLDKDKEAYRQKLNEYEQKAKESESRRASLMFEYEKERAKWQLEKENLLSIKSDLTEQVEKLQVRKDQLLRENEKLRTENKGSRKYLFGNATNIPPSGQVSQSNIGLSSIGQSHHNSTSATRYMVGKSMSNAVGNNILTQAIGKLKENNKYIGGGGMNHRDEDQVNIGSNTQTNNTTPNTKHYNRYGH